MTLCFLLGCTGTIADSHIQRNVDPAGDDPGVENTVDTDGDGVPDAPAPGTGGTPGQGSNRPGGGDGSGGMNGTDGPDAEPLEFAYATVGTRCSGGSRQRFVVVSREPGNCESHARALDDQSARDVLRLSVGDSGAFSGPVSLCDGASCRDVNVNVALSADEGRADLEAELSDEELERTLEVERCDYDAVVPPSRDALAADVSIRELALYQGVKVALATDGQEAATRNAPVVEGRPGLLRVFVEPSAAFSSRDIVARLLLEQNGGETETLETTLRVSGASSDGAPDSTLNFELSGAQIGQGTRYSVSLHEADVCGGAPADTSGGARFPATGRSELAAESPGSPLRVVLVPVRYNADGSGRTPDLSDAVVQSYREYLYSLFPVAELEISLRAPIDFDGGVLANGDGWTELLDACLSQRLADNVDPKTYYYCIFDPASSFRNYCNGGCVSGLGPVPSANDRTRRGSIGLGFPEGDSAGTMAHEIGHSLGRPHAPCGGPAGPDPGYPYTGGSIGSWGYDLRTGQLLAPERHTDLMGYCQSTWISDYNYDLLFTRFQAVLTAPRVLGEPLALTSIIVDPHGELKLGRASTTRELPEGDGIRVHYLGLDGLELGSASGTYTEVTHVAGGIAYVPTPPAGTARISIESLGVLEL